MKGRVKKSQLKMMKGRVKQINDDKESQAGPAKADKEESEPDHFLLFTQNTRF